MKRRFHYYSHRGRRGHPTTLLERLGTGVVFPALLVVAATFIATGAIFLPQAYVTTGGTLLTALGVSVLRLLVAYLFSLVIGIILGLIAERNRRLESILLPIYDILESMPVLAFFPVIIIFCLRQNWAEGAALFMLFFSMVWNIAFNTIGGMRQTPADVQAVGQVFGLAPVRRFFLITLPALIPPLTTGSILALADGWNILIVAEALHAYAPQAIGAKDLFGIGSILVSASSTGNTGLLLAAMGVLVAAIAIMNLGVWQPLLARAERYKFE